MAAIGSIRKHSVFLMVIIGLALFLFLLTGLFDSNTLFRIFKADQYKMGTVDGDNIDEKYRTNYDYISSLMKVIQKRESFSESENYQIHQISWEQTVDDILLTKELKKLGIIITPEIAASLMEDAKNSLTTQQPQPYIGAFAEYLIPLIGMDNVLPFLTNIDEYKDDPRFTELYKLYKGVENRVIFEKKLSSYLALAQGSMNFSDTAASQLSSSNLSVLGSLVSVNPAAEAFKNVVVSPAKKDIKKYYEDNKYKYIVKENTRDIDMAIFPIQPTPTDKANIEANVREKFEKFSTLPIDTFNRYEAFAMVDSTYHKMGDPVYINTSGGYQTIQATTLDTMLFTHPVGTLIRPYNDNDQMWYFGKSYGASSHADSILVAFLFVDFKSQQNPNGSRTKKEARLEKDSLENLLKTNKATIFQLLPNYLAGRKATDTTAWYPENQVGRQLYQKLLNTPTGGIYVDNIPTGFVIYQVLGRTAPVAKRQYALYAFEIKASEETIETLRKNASQLASSSSTTEELITNANNAGIRLVNGKNIPSMAATINDIQNCRSVVYWAFNNENVKKGSVSDVIKLTDQMFVVASVNNIHNKGVEHLDNVKEDISNELTVIDKLAEIQKIIEKDIASSQDLSALSVKYDTRFLDSITFLFNGESYQNFGLDNVALGKLFSNQTTGVKVITGKNMVYVINPYSFDNKTNSNQTPQMSKNILRNIVLGRNRNEMTIIEGLKDKVKIWDNRSRFYQ